MSHLDSIAEKVAASDRLTEAEVAEVSASRDIIGIGSIADRLRRRKHGDVVTFVRVQLVQVVRSLNPIEVLPGAGELRLVGEPRSAQDAVAMTARISEVAGGVPVTGFEIGQLAGICGSESGLVQLLTELSAAGLAMVSEARTDDQHCWAWLDCAGRAGLQVARLALVVDAASDEVAQFQRVAKTETAAQTVRALAPLASRPETPATSGFRDIRRVALARLLVDNIDSIQVDWGRDGPKLAQVALAFGADDVDAVPATDVSEHGRRRSSLEEITRNIRAASLVPIQRNGRFDRLDA